MAWKNNPFSAENKASRRYKKYVDCIELCQSRVQLYTEYLPQYIEILKDECSQKVKRYIAKQQAKIKVLELPLLDDESAFKQLYGKKIEKQKTKLRMQFRAEREKLRREKAKLLLEQPESDTTAIDQRIERFEQQKFEEGTAYESLCRQQFAQYLQTKEGTKEEYQRCLERAKKEIQIRCSEVEWAINVKYANKSNKAHAKYTALVQKWQAKLDITQKEFNKFLSDTNFGDVTIEEGTVLSIRNLSKHFGGLKAVDQLSFDVKEGEIFGLIGPNGAGKTTVFNCITQFYKPTAGDICFRTKSGKAISLNREVVYDVILLGIARTFQNIEVIKEVSVLDNLLIAATRQYHANLFEQMFHLPILKLEEQVIRARAEKVLEFLNLTQYRSMLAWGLPYGILKKIEIARTLMSNPQLIILDEPAAGLNDTETAELSKLIKRIQQEYKATILLVEHDMGLVMEICDHICAISFGKMLALGTPAEVQNDKTVQEAYLGTGGDE